MGPCPPDACLQTVGFAVAAGAFAIAPGGADRMPTDRRRYRRLVGVSAGETPTAGADVTGLRVGWADEPGAAVWDGALSQGAVLPCCLDIDLDSRPLAVSGTVPGADGTVLMLTFITGPVPNSGE